MELDKSEVSSKLPDSESSQGERTRTFRWSDPSIGLEASQKLSGLEYLKAVASGGLPPPPLIAALGIDEVPVTVEPDKVTFFLEPKEYHYNTIGSVHGGVLATLLDSAMGCAIHTRVRAGAGYTTLDLNISYVRPVTLRTGRLRCEGTVLSAGRRVATAQGRILDERDKLYAHATTTCLLLDPAHSSD